MPYYIIMLVISLSGFALVALYDRRTAIKAYLQKTYYRFKYARRVSAISTRHSQDHAVGYISAKQGMELAALMAELKAAPAFLPIDSVSILAGHAMYHMDVEAGYYGAFAGALI